MTPLRLSPCSGSSCSHGLLRLQCLLRKLFRHIIANPVNLGCARPPPPSHQSCLRKLHLRYTSANSLRAHSTLAATPLSSLASRHTFHPSPLCAASPLSSPRHTFLPQALSPTTLSVHPRFRFTQLFRNYEYPAPSADSTSKPRYWGVSSVANWQALLQLAVQPIPTVLSPAHDANRYCFVAGAACNHRRADLLP